MEINCPFKQFKNLFGIEKKGIHSYRMINDTPIFDYLITIIGSMMISYFTKIPLVLTTIVVLLVGILVHLLFGVQTNTLTYLGIKCS